MPGDPLEKRNSVQLRASGAVEGRDRGARPGPSEGRRRRRGCAPGDRREERTAAVRLGWVPVVGGLVEDEEASRWSARRCVCLDGGEVEPASAAVEVASIPARVLRPVPLPTSPPSPGRDVLALDGSAAAENPPGCAGACARTGGRGVVNPLRQRIYISPPCSTRFGLKGARCVHNRGATTAPRPALPVEARDVLYEEGRPYVIG